MPTDILLGEDLDLHFRNGDLVAGESSEQHQKLLLVVDKGHIKQFPFVGVGIGSFLLDDNLGGLHQEIEQQFNLDGAKIQKREIYEDGTMNIEASYE